MYYQIMAYKSFTKGRMIHHTVELNMTTHRKVKRYLEHAISTKLVSWYEISKVGIGGLVKSVDSIT